MGHARCLRKANCFARVHGRIRWITADISKIPFLQQGWNILSVPTH